MRTTSIMRRLDGWVASHPFHPRILPWAVYLVFLAIIGPVRSYMPATYPVMYLLQCAVVVWLIWRYRRHVPELTLSFHWLALPVGVGVAWVWIVLGRWMARPDVLGGAFADVGTESLLEEMGDPTLGWVTFVLRLVGMSLVPPLIEEVFNRSLVMRCFHSARSTWTGMLQIIHDLPMVGDWLMHTSAGRRAGAQPLVFTPALESTPLGQLSVFSVVASTLVFMAVHHPRDYPACFLCGVAYALLLGLTRARGLGPVIWAHGITNALLWLYTWSTISPWWTWQAWWRFWLQPAGVADWRFL